MYLSILMSTPHCPDCGHFAVNLETRLSMSSKCVLYQIYAGFLSPLHLPWKLGISISQEPEGTWTGMALKESINLGERTF